MRDDPGASQPNLTRRALLSGASTAAVAAAIAGCSSPAANRGAGRSSAGAEAGGPKIEGAVPLTLRINGKEHRVRVDPRTTLLDCVRETVALTGTKKGCDHGQCGACTVLLDGRRATTCLALAVAHDDAKITTANGLADGEELHPVARAFLGNDGFQCGYCTPGQICSAVGMLDEVKVGWPSHVTDDLAGGVDLDDEEIRERMSGNLCRCGAYANIVAAIREAAR